MTEREQAERDMGVAREEALRALVSNLVYVAIMLGVSIGIAKRDWFTQQGIRLRHAVRDRSKWRESRLVAELQADISRIEHNSSIPDQTGRESSRGDLGMYGGVSRG